MAAFSPEALQAAAREKEATLTTHGRSTGRPHRVTIRLAADGRRIFIRSGGASVATDLIAGGKGTRRLGDHELVVSPRHV